ncbi:MAG: histone deacetylase family protein [Novosphingobium sp.]|nr:histone deacetylase family protein [Novosphingobium sp.]
MTTALVTHPACLEHDTGPGHPERADRLRAVLDALATEEFADLRREEAPRATPEQLTRVHDRGYVERLLAVSVPEGRHAALDADTVISAASTEAALRAAGGATHAVDLVLDGGAESTFVAVRPPGHHAEPGRAMGFCLFNNAAVAALHARARGLTRIAVADFDVHHGNGTQAAFWSEADLFFASSHQRPLYPGTGSADEQGAAGNIVNAPLPGGTRSAGFRLAWRNLLLPALDAFAPELLVVSAGFDAHRADPLANLELETEDFAWVTRELVALARRHAGGRIVSCLEGGYDLAALAASAAAHVRELI